MPRVRPSMSASSSSSRARKLSTRAGNLIWQRALAFQRIMYNQLLFHCPWETLDVIFMSVSNQCPQGPPFRESSHLNVCRELPEARLEHGLGILNLRRSIRNNSPAGEQSLKER